MNSENNNKIALLYTVIAIALILITLLYVGVTMLTDTELISYENLYYMMNDLNITAISIGKDYSTLSYGNGEGQTFGTYRGGVVVLNSDTLTVFSSKGKRTLYKSNDISDPVLRTSDEYVTVFELNGEGISIYNSFSLVYTENDLEGINKLTSYSIVDVSVADNGMFAVAVNIAQDDSRVYLYNKSGVLCADYKYSDLIVSVSLSSDGELISILSLMTKPVNTKLAFSTKVYSTDATEPVWEYLREDTIAVAQSFTYAGTLITAYSDAIYVYNNAEAVGTEYALPSDTRLDYCEVNESGCVAIYGTYGKDIAETTVTVIDADGRRAYSVSSSDTDGKLYGAYYLNNNILCCIDGSCIDAVDIDRGYSDRIDCQTELDGASIVAVKTREGKDASFAVCFGAEGKIFDIELKRGS